MGAPLLPGLPSLFAYRMEGVRPRQRLNETPVFMRVGEPCRSLPCDFSRGKVKGKSPDFHNFLRYLWGFCLFLPIFARICRFLGRRAHNRPVILSGACPGPQRQVFVAGVGERSRRTCICSHFRAPHPWRVFVFAPRVGYHKSSVPHPFRFFLRKGWDRNHHLSPNNTFFLGFKLAAMGVFNAFTIGVASLK